MKKYVENLFNLSGKDVIITGGAGMLGSEYADVLGGAGARVILFDILSPQKMESHAHMLSKKHGISVYGISVDVTNEKGISASVKEVIRRFKRIDILINNAALTDLSKASHLSPYEPYERFPSELWKKELDVSLNGSLYCVKAVTPYMMKRKSGVIVNISSTYGVVAPDNRIYTKGKFKSLSYMTVKSAILNFTRALASYYASHGIRVNTLTLGGVYAGHDKRFTDAYSFRTMLGRMAHKDEYRGAMLYLCSDASSYMTGSNLIIDGGWTAW
mgnify:CR=1 FL=1